MQVKCLAGILCGISSKQYLTLALVFVYMAPIFCLQIGGIVVQICLLDSA